MMTDLHKHNDAAGPGPAPQPPQRDYPSLARTAYVCNVIIAINVLVYVAMGLSGVGWMEPDGSQMLNWGADYWPLTTSGQLWRLVTAAFLHFGAIHLLANMYALGSVGWLIERLFGSVFFGLLYLLSAILSSAVSIWWERDSICAGASGAVFAVYGALFGYLMVQRATFPRHVVSALLKSTAIFVGYNVLYGLSRPGISNSAHLSGLVSGVVLGALFARPLDPVRRAAQTRWRAALAGVVSVLAVGGVVLGLPNGDFNLAAERAFAVERKHVSEGEHQATAAYNALVDRMNQKEDQRPAEEKNKAFAAGLDKEVIPVWESMASRLEALAIGKTSPSRPLRDTLLAFCRWRAQAYRTLSAALKKGGDDAGLAKYKAQLKQSDEAAAHLKDAAKTAFPG